MTAKRAAVWLWLCGAVLALYTCGAAEEVGDTEHFRVHPPYYTEASDNEVKLYAKVVGAEEALWMKVVPRTGERLLESLVFFNLDQNRATGHNPWGPTKHSPRGYEYYARITEDHQVEVYTGCIPRQSARCRDLIFIVRDSAINIGSNDELEFYIPISIFSGWDGDFEVAAVINSIRHGAALYSEQVTTVDIPSSLSNYHQVYTDLPFYLDNPCEKDPTERRVAMVYDRVNEDSLYGTKSYAILYTSMQSQVRQAGIPQDLIYATALRQVTKMCKYDMIALNVMPSAADAEVARRIKKALFLLTQVYGVGLLLTGEFITRTESRKGLDWPEAHMMESLLGITPEYARFGSKVNNIILVDSTEELFSDLSKGTLIATSENVGQYVEAFRAADNTAFKVVQAARQLVSKNIHSVMSYSAILTSEIKNNMFGRQSGRIVHFATPEQAANTNAVWRAVQWVTRKNSPVLASLLISRHKAGVFTCRNDADLSMYKSYANIGPDLLRNVIEPLYVKYNFVSSYFINIGNNVRKKQYTDWASSKNLYSKFMDLENEIGTHSYTHPRNIDALSRAKFEFEFGQSKEEIMEKLDLSRLGAAQPGKPESLQSDQLLDPILADTYFSGGYSGFIDEFANAFGFLSPGSKMLYTAPNLRFDYTFEQKRTPPDGQESIWAQEIDFATHLANGAIIQWPIHDYSITEYNTKFGVSKASDTYSFSVFEHTIAYAASKGFEFVTIMDLHDRIRATTASRLFTKVTSTTSMQVTVELTATVTDNLNLGHHAIQLEHPNPALNYVIVSAGDHFAFDDLKLFVPANGGTFDIEFGIYDPAETRILTHIEQLDMRMQLVDVSGDGRKIEFRARGKGMVRVRLHPNVATSSTKIIVDEGVSIKTDYTKQVVDLHFPDINQLYSTKIIPGEDDDGANDEQEGEYEGGGEEEGEYASDSPACAFCESAELFEAAISNTENCTLLETQERSKLCGCDMSLRNVIQPNGAVFLAQACDDTLESKDDFEVACATLCNAEPSCSGWTVWHGGEIPCYLYTCDGTVSTRPTNSTFRSGTACREV